jgi:uncharacterized protein YndB with AHSA1/START domain
VNDDVARDAERAASADAIRVTTLVAVDPAAAFAAFTEDVDAWWRRGPRYRPLAHPNGVMRLEPGVGGRLLEEYGDRADERFELGRVRVWDPPARLVLLWRNRSFAPGEETEVEIRFDARPNGTLVQLEHRGFGALRDDHPTRHGLGRGPAFEASMGLWWGEMLLAAKDHAGRARR